MEFNKMLLNNSEFLRPFATTLTRDSEVAKDLFQDTLYRALVNRDKYNVGTNIKAWLYTIMRNIFINNYRRRSQQKTITVPSIYDYLPEPPAGHSVNSESILEAKEIMHTIHRLPSIYKTPFHLYFEGFHYQEIANILREPLGTIKSRIHFARKILKDQLTNY